MEQEKDRVPLTTHTVRLTDRTLAFFERWHTWVLFVSMLLTFATAILALVSIKGTYPLVPRLAVVTGLAAFVSLVYSVIGYQRSAAKWMRYLTRQGVELRSYTVDSVNAIREVLEVQPATTEPPYDELPEKGPLVPFSSGDEIKTRERNTLLVIIAVLCAEAKIDHRQAAKAAGTIKNRAVMMGLNLGETTIEGHLKKIPGSIEARSR